jgi:Leucine-rich repeat (LRR) protein
MSSNSIIEELRRLSKERDTILNSIMQYEDILSMTRLMDIVNSSRIFSKITSIETLKLLKELYLQNNKIKAKKHFHFDA